jgi:ubiquinone biosynthesis protein
VSEVFASFDRTPIAAASIAQVHAATLMSRARVVVKVRRPDVSQTVDRDLDITGRLAARLERSTSWGRAVGAAGLAAGLAAALREELDLRVEARNMTSVAAASDSRGSDGIAIPVPCQPLCTARVLVMERLDGRPLAAIDARTPADVRAALARSLLDCLLRQVMLEGTFHADPHPGNVLLLADGRLGLLDFGSVGRIDAGLRTALQGCCWPWTGATRPASPTRCWKWSSGPGNWTSRAWNGCWAGSWPGTPDPGSPPT